MCEWGLDGARAVVVGANVAVVVDVLSFTTTLTVALDVGTVVLPFRWKDARAADFAREHGAELAVGRARAGPGEVSLSPLTLRAGTPPARLVLPSPNGSAIAHELGATAGLVVVGASLRNADAVGDWIASHFDAEATVVAVIAAGERWPSGALRPAVEDLWGAGAVVSSLGARGWHRRSPEADAAAAAYALVTDDLARALRSSASGRELIEQGFGADVDVAAERGSSRSVPVLRHGCFTPAF